MTSLTPLATAELGRRRDWLRQQLRAGRITAAQAEARPRPWAAIALRAGAPCPALSTELAEREAAGDRWPRLTLAEDLCPLPALRKELTRARDAALPRIWAGLASDEEARRALGLVRLATHFGAPAYEPAPVEQRAAA